MGDMMGMGLRVGREGVATEGSIGRACAMDMESTSFTQGIHMPESGVMDRVTAWERRRVLMGAAMSENSSVVLNMGSDVTISGMEIGTPVSTSEIKSMVSVSITSPTAIFMKDRGMKAGSKAMECTLSEVVRLDVENGTMAISRFPSPLSQMQFFEQFRQPGRLQKMQSTFAGLTSKSTRLWWRQIGLPPRPELLLSKLFRIGSMENFATLTCEINKHYITGKCKFTTEFPYEKYRT